MWVLYPHAPVYTPAFKGAAMDELVILDAIQLDLEGLDPLRIQSTGCQAEVRQLDVACSIHEEVLMGDRD